MGGSKKQTIGYKYYLGMHLILGLGPFDKLLGMFADKKTAWEGDISSGSFIVNAENLFGGEEKEGGISGQFTLQMGEPTQVNDPYLAVKLFPGPIPAFRGVVGIIAKQAYVGTQTYLKNLAFLAQRIHVRQDGIEQWYDEKSEITDGVVATRVSTVVSSSKGMAASPDGLSWPYDSSSYTGGGAMYRLEINDTKDCFLGVSYQNYDVWRSYDGFNWESLSPGIGTPDGGRYDLAFFDGYWFVTSGGYNVKRSLDGEIWINDSVQVDEFIVGPGRMLGIATLPNHIKILDSANGSWLTGITKPPEFAAEYGANGAYGNGRYKIASGNTSGGITYPLIWTTIDGVTTLINDTLPSGLFTNQTMEAIAYGNERFVAITKKGQILVKEDEGIWVLKTDVKPFTEDCRLKFFNNQFFLGIRNSDFTGDIWVSPTADNGSWVSVGPIEYSTSTGYAAIGDLAGGAIIGQGGSTGDMNPAHIIRECLTDPDWGLGYQDSDIDDVSFTAAADILFNERFGLSLLWNRQTTVEDFIKEIVKHIDASLFVDRKTGKFKIVLIRDNFVIDDLITLDASNIEKVSDFVRPTFGELTNSITVQYWDKELRTNSSVTVQDIALAQMQGSTINTTQTYSGVTTKELAARIAQRDLKTVSTPSASCTIYANRDASELELGSPFKFTWPDFKCNELVMRVTSIAYGDGRKNRIRLTCTQDVYKLPDTAIIVPETPVWTDPNTAPVAATLRKPFEVPYLEAVQQQGQTAVDAVISADPTTGYAGIAVGRPSQASTNANLYTNSGAGFGNKSTFDFCPTAKLGVPVNQTETTFELIDIQDADLITVGSWVQIDEELVSIVSFDGTDLVVKRGVLDTIPAAHLLNVDLFFWDSFAGIDSTGYVEGETIDIKVTPITGQGELALVDAPTDEIEIVGRIARPYPPANLTINGNYWPIAEDDYTLVLQWVDRNRLTQTGNSLVGWYDTEVTKESGVTYSLRVFRDSDDELIYSDDNISLSEYTIPFVNESEPIRLEVWSVRNGIPSYQKFSHVFSIANALLAETSDILLTESNQIIALEGTPFIQALNMYPIAAFGDTVYAGSPIVEQLDSFYVSSDGGLTYTEIINTTGDDVRITYANSGSEHYFATLSDGTYVSIAFNSLGDTASRYVIARQVTGDLADLPNTVPTDSGSNGDQDAFLYGYPRTATDYVRTVALGSDGTNFYLVGYYPDPAKPQGYRLFKAGASMVLTDLGAIAQDVTDPNTLAPTSPASWSAFFAANMKLEKFGVNWILSSSRAAYWINDIEDLNLWRWANLQLNENTRTNPEMNLQRLIQADGVILAFDGAINMAAVSKSSDDGETWTAIYPSAIRDGILRHPVVLADKAIIQGVGSSLEPETGILESPFTAWTLHDTTGLPTGSTISNLIATDSGIVGSTNTGYLIASTNGYEFTFAQKE